jgi:hypothetical protein
LLRRGTSFASTRNLLCFVMEPPLFRHGTSFVSAMATVALGNRNFGVMRFKAEQSRLHSKIIMI